jgi:hypothetical protein
LIEETIMSKYVIQPADEVSYAEGPIYYGRDDETGEPTPMVRGAVVVFLAVPIVTPDGTINEYVHNHGYTQLHDVKRKIEAVKARGVIDLDNWTAVYVVTDRERELQEIRDMEDEYHFRDA